MEDANPPRPVRSLTRFYVAIGVVAVLMGLGILLYKPLRLKYAIHRLEHADPKECGLYRPLNVQCGRWIDDVARGARRGNVPAMRALLKQLSLPGSLELPVYDNAGWVAIHQPGLFIQELERLPDEDVKMVLQRLLNDLSGYDDSVPGFWQEVQLKGFAQDFENRLQSKDRRIREAALAALDFMRRRFAKELAEDVTALERRIAAAPYGGRSGDVSGSIGLSTERIVLAGKLAEAGPAVYPNLRRLLTSPDQRLRAEVLSAFHHPRYAWLLPLIVESARDGSADTVEEAYSAARSIVGGSPNPMQPAAPFDENTARQQRVEELRKALLAWWAREGQAKHGGGGK